MAAVAAARDNFTDDQLDALVEDLLAKKSATRVADGSLTATADQVRRDATRWVPAIPSCEYRLDGGKKVAIQMVHCFHTVVDVGYVVCDVVSGQRDSQRETTTESDKQFNDLREQCAAPDCDKATKAAAGKCMGQMRKLGQLESVETTVPRVAYLLDTTAEVLGPCQTCKKAAQSGAQPVMSAASMPHPQRARGAKVASAFFCRTMRPTRAR